MAKKKPKRPYAPFAAWLWLLLFGMFAALFAAAMTWRCD